jgi:hypothetical protein
LLAEARAARDVAGAIDLYSKFLEQNPNNAVCRRGWVRKR